MRKYLIIAGGLLLSLVLGATVFREPIAQAATGLTATIVGPLDSGGNLKVHEQGTAQVNVTNSSLNVTSSAPVPYQHTTFFNQTATTCTSYVCTVSFPAVPAGKRLVVTYASAQYGLTSGGNFATVSVGVNGNSSSSPQILLPAAVLSGASNWVAAGPVSYFAEAGDVPTMQLAGQFTQPVSNTAEASIVGYLVDAP